MVVTKRREAGPPATHRLLVQELPVSAGEVLGSQLSAGKPITHGFLEPVHSAWCRYKESRNQAICQTFCQHTSLFELFSLSLTPKGTEKARETDTEKITTQQTGRQRCQEEPAEQDRGRQKTVRCQAQRRSNSSRGPRK